MQWVLNVGYLTMNMDVWFHDTRHFGRFDIYQDEKIFQSIMDKMGPDFLSHPDGISREVWFSKVRLPRVQHMEICKFLMEQKYFSGIGNYLKAEILYRAKIRPNRLLRELSDDDLELIRVTSNTTVWESYRSHGLSIKSYWDPMGRPGMFQRVVYGFQTDPLGNPVITNEFTDKRTTHWVPAVQV
jgi:formamidopyrimidine-DNA glycosylase